jgi:hypothetical protein
MMPTKPKRNGSDVESLLTDLLIAQLAVSGVQQQTIRRILGCDVNRVSKIFKPIKAARKAAEAQAKLGE